MKILGDSNRKRTTQFVVNVESGGGTERKFTFPAEEDRANLYTFLHLSWKRAENYTLL